MRIAVENIDIENNDILGGLDFNLVFGANVLEVSSEF